MKSVKNLSKEELEKLEKPILRDLNLLTRFYFECIRTNQTGVIKKPSPKQMLKFLKKHLKHEPNN